MGLVVVNGELIDKCPGLLARLSLNNLSERTLAGPSQGAPSCEYSLPFIASPTQ